MWMMILTVFMLVNGQMTEVGQVQIKNFPNQPACLGHMATVTLSLPSLHGVHNVSVTCQPQP